MKHSKKRFLFFGLLRFGLSKSVWNVIRRSALLFIILLGVFLLFISTNKSHYAEDIRVELTSFFTPLLKVLASPGNFLVTKSEDIDKYLFAYEKNKALEIENLQLKKQLILFAQLKSENKSLKELLNFVEDNNFYHITTRVVGDLGGPYINSLLVDAGEKENIKKNMAVIGQKGLVGRVIEVGEKSARILLITDINSHIPVISSFSKERAIVEGENKPYLKLKFVSKESKLRKGEIMMTSGDGGLFPANLAVGIVDIDEKGRFNVKPFEEIGKIVLLTILGDSPS